MKRFLYLATAALVASLLLAPAAAAQGQGQMMDQNMIMDQGSESRTLQLTSSGTPRSAARRRSPRPPVVCRSN